MTTPLTSSRSFIVLAALLLGGWPSSARAQKSPDPHALFIQGVELFDNGDFEAALAKLEEALSLAPRKQNAIRLYLGLVYAKQARCKDALAHLDEVRGTKLKRKKHERMRTDAEANCRFERVAGHMKDGECPAALKELDTLSKLRPKAAAARKLKDRKQEASACARYFPTEKPRGREAARLLAIAKERLAAKEHEEAIVRAEASLEKWRSGIAQLVIAQALTAQGKCADAVPILDEVSDQQARKDKTSVKLLRADEAQREKLETICFWEEAQALFAEYRCLRALPLLAKLRRKLSGDEKRRRSYYEKRCEPFPRDTRARRKAYKGLVAAMEDRRRGRLDLAAKGLSAVLELVDDAKVRRELAAVHLDRGTCDDMTRALTGIPPSQRSKLDDAHMEACETYRLNSKLGLGPKQRKEYYEAVAQGLVAHKEKDLCTVVAKLEGPVEKGNNIKLWALYTAALSDMGRCADFRRSLGKRPQHRHEVPDLARRHNACEPEPQKDPKPSCFTRSVGCLPPFRPLKK